jgi:glycosyltransferase involved in cell wall biosynthesis
MSIVDVDFAPPILPVPADIQRPLWSVMIPTYNCAQYLRLTLESVLAQDPGPDRMQIEVVDDCSTQDDPEAVVRELGQGRVQFFRQPKNGGAIANFNSCLRRSKGELVHILHGDDLVQDKFYERFGHPFTENPNIGAAFCRQIYIDEAGHQRVETRLEQSYPGILPNALSILAVSNRIQPPAIVVRRRVYQTLGGYRPSLFHAADWEMWVRIASYYPIWYEIEPLALYRVHSSSDTSRLFRTGANVQDRRKCIMIYRSYLPPDKADLLSRKALGYSVLYALRTAYNFLRAGQGRTSLVQLREAIVCIWNLFQLRLV